MLVSVTESSSSEAEMNVAGAKYVALLLVTFARAAAGCGSSSVERG
jgi:hypothetical protein